MKKAFSLFLALIFIIFALAACTEDDTDDHTHAYGEWLTVKEASCSQVGERERECACGEKEIQEIEMPAHNFADATCLKPKTCKDCGVTEGEPAAHIGNDAKCENIVCTVCKKVLKEQTHDFSPITEDTPNLISGATIYEKCSKCSEIKITEAKPIGPQELDMPVIYITDIDKNAIPLFNLTKPDGEIKVKYEYVSNSEDIESFECFCEIKVQGASSQYYPKKNFTVKFFEDEALSSKLKVDLGWGKQTKYCMKANYVDSSHARNIVAATLFTEVVQSRDNINSGLTEKAPNYGVIDGYPVLVYLNGEFHGLYTMNIPKDKWTFGMKGGEESREALLMADHWSNSVNLKEEIGVPYEDYEWEVEHCSTADDSWIRESFNELIRLLNCGDNEKIKQELPAHLDIEAAIDNMLFTFAIGAGDNVSKNILWATYDGEVWIPSMYDMDGTFGIAWDGRTIESAENFLFPKLTGNKNQLHDILILCYADEVEARWNELRGSVLTYSNVSEKFDAFFAKIPDIVYTSEHEKWKEIPNAKANLTNMYSATEQHLTRLDTFFGNLSN